MRGIASSHGVWMTRRPRSAPTSRTSGWNTPYSPTPSGRLRAWVREGGSTPFGANPGGGGMEHPLPPYPQGSAGGRGGEWFAAEFARREEEERLQRGRPVGGGESGEPPVQAPSPEVTLIDASV